MAIVQSGGQLRTLSAPPPGYGDYTSGSSWSSSFWGYGGNAWAFAQIYATQPNIRTCADFLARGIADCGLHWFRRVSDTDRVRLKDFPVAQWLDHPNYATTRYRLVESLVADLAIYFNAYWMKVRLSDRIGLVRLPPTEMQVMGGLLPSHYIYTAYGAEAQALDLSEVVYFNGYNPLNTLMGLSPLVTLARMLAEETAAAEHRESYWLNSAQVEGVIERPKDAPRWTPTQKQSWREQWQARHAGAAGAGTVPVLEDGMVFKQISQSFRDSEYINARKLSRTECAAAYHIPPPFVGDLEHATFSNIKEQHKQLYADTLGPWFTMIELALELWLLPEVARAVDTSNVYCEFNVSEKLKGNFEEQTASLAVAVRRAFMTPNEARARLNLPSIKDDPTADQLAPQQGGPPTAIDNTDTPPTDATATDTTDTSKPQPTALTVVPRASMGEADADAA
jgi:HK97 family phage portal protein